MKVKNSSLFLKKPFCFCVTFIVFDLVKEKMPHLIDNYSNLFSVYFYLPKCLDVPDSVLKTVIVIAYDHLEDDGHSFERIECLNSFKIIMKISSKFRFFWILLI